MACLSDGKMIGEGTSWELELENILIHFFGGGGERRGGGEEESGEDRGEEGWG